MAEQGKEMLILKESQVLRGFSPRYAAPEGMNIQVIQETAESGDRTCLST